jgi:hypothetical protein
LLVGASNAGAVAEVCAVHVRRDRDRVTGNADPVNVVAWGDATDRAGGPLSFTDLDRWSPSMSYKVSVSAPCSTMREHHTGWSHTSAEPAAMTCCGDVTDA